MDADIDPDHSQLIARADESIEAMCQAHAAGDREALIEARDRLFDLLDRHPDDVALRRHALEAMKTRVAAARPGDEDEGRGA